MRLGRALPLVAGGAALLAVLALIPLLSPERTGTTTTTTIIITGLSERPPFGQPLPGRIVYLGADRVLNLVDLGTGTRLGSKGVAADQRPAAASAATAIVGSLPAGTVSGNWDRWVRLAWEGTDADLIAIGHGIAYAPEHDAIAAAMTPLPSGQNGVQIVTADETWEAVSSTGAWGFPTWMGDAVLAREQSGAETNWWLLPAAAPGDPAEVALPDDFIPIAGTAGRVMGRLGDEGVIAVLDTGELLRLPSGWSWAAEWQPGSDQPILATVGGPTSAVVGYNRDGTVAWTWPLGEAASEFRGGVAWSPDGSFLVAPGQGGVIAINEFGGVIGTMDAGLPPPEVSDAGFVAVVPG